VIQRVTIRKPSDPIERLADDLYHAAPGDLAMFMGAIQRHDYPGALALARDLWAPQYAETILGPMMVRPGISMVAAVALMRFLRDRVVHPQ